MNLICPYCNLKCGNQKVLDSHLKKCIKNPNVFYCDYPVFYDENVTYSNKQKIKYVCSQCGEENVVFYQNFLIALKNNYICGKCRQKISIAETISKNPGIWIKRNEKTKQTNLKKYGATSYNQTKEGKEKLKAVWQNKTEEEIKLRSEKYKSTCLKKYGKDSYFKTDEFRTKSKNKCLEKYNAEFYSQTEEYKQRYKQSCIEKYGVESHNKAEICKEKNKMTCLRHWGVDNFRKSKEMQKLRKPVYIFNDIHFDSKDELAFYIYSKDLGLNIVRNKDRLIYIFDGKEFGYFPDFKINDEYYEIKGEQFLKEDGTWQNPFDHSLDSLYEAKHLCAIDNKVNIIYSKDCQKYIEYVNINYGDLFEKVKK